MKRILFCILFFGVLFACKKQHTVKIKAINAVTGEPYAGLEYGVSATKTGANGEKLVYDHTGTLDANGEAYVTLKVKTGRTYNIGCTKPPNTCYVKDIKFTYGQEDPANPSFVFEYAECGYLQLKVKNVNCFDSNDEIFFNLKPIYTSDSYKIIQMTKFGCYDNEFIDEKVPAGTWKAEWNVTRNGVVTQHDSVFSFPENHHYYFSLEY